MGVAPSAAALYVELVDDSLRELYAHCLHAPHPNADHYHVMRKVYGVLVTESGALTWDEARARSGRMLGHAAVYGCVRSGCKRAHEDMRA